MSDQNLLSLTAGIVSAHVSHNATSISDIPSLIRSTFDVLTSLGAPKNIDMELEPVPAVSIRTSVKPDHLVCLECGTKLKMLKRHIMTDHGLTVDAYRARWKLPASYPAVAPSYSEHRKQLAMANGLGHRPREKRRR